MDGGECQAGLCGNVSALRTGNNGRLSQEGAYSRSNVIEAAGRTACPSPLAGGTIFIRMLTEVVLTLLASPPSHSIQFLHSFLCCLDDAGVTARPQDGGSTGPQHH